MVDIQDIFKHKVYDEKKLRESGFINEDDVYKKSFLMMQKQFLMQVSITKTNKVQFLVYDMLTREEYVLVHNPKARGEFVGQVRDECEKVLRDICEQCFDTKIFQFNQTMRIIDYIYETFHIEPEFPWEKSPDYAVFRRVDNQKWFVIIMSITGDKIGLSSGEKIEIMNLKDIPENVQKRVNDKYFFKAYHMNKKHWYTVCLDERVLDDELMSLIQKSYELTK